MCFMCLGRYEVNQQRDIKGASLTGGGWWCTCLYSGKGRSSYQGGTEGVCRVVMDHAEHDGWNYLCQPKWTSLAEEREFLYGLGCSLDQVIIL